MRIKGNLCLGSWLALNDHCGLVECSFKGWCTAPLEFPRPWIQTERLEVAVLSRSLSLSKNVGSCHGRSLAEGGTELRRGFN